MENKEKPTPYTTGAIIGIGALGLSFFVTFIYLSYKESLKLLDHSYNQQIFGFIPGFIVLFLIALYSTHLFKKKLDNKIIVVALVIYYTVSFTYYVTNVHDISNFFYSFDSTFGPIMLIIIIFLISFGLMKIPGKTPELKYKNGK